MMAGAEKLKTMQVPDIIIAIDGYSSTGKSSFAKLIAETFSFLYLDSGAIYRGVTLFSLENGFINKDKIETERLKRALEDLDIHFEYSDRKSQTYMGTRCIEKEIRTLEVSGSVSPISTLPFVRDYVDERLKSFGKKGRVVMDGRDIGTAVFPDAQVKIFMTAAYDIRAQRRFEEMKAKGESPEIEEVLKNLKERDYIDSHREMNPLTKASDAFVLDNSNMSLNDELLWFKGLLQGKFGILE